MHEKCKICFKIILLLKMCMCVCKFWKNEHSQTHKIGPFYSKTCEIAIARRTPQKWPHARTSHTCFESLFARTSHTCERARTCARANLISQLTDCKTRKVWRKYGSVSHLCSCMGYHTTKSCGTIFMIEVRDIHIECSKQFKWNTYFCVSWQSRPFWAALKLL